MKLYTEEQIKQILEELQKAFLPKNIECDGSHCIGCWKDVVRKTMQMANSFTPIELPSDEEIEKRYYKELDERREIAKNFTGQVAGRHPDMFGHSEIHHMVTGYMECVKWMRDKIQGGNK